ncbi:hypothetical protein SNEBB_000545 [Seison nebaliae]|nr:hypothetical protein SNEBB_000545 [Seison nebaliae]
MNCPHLVNIVLMSFSFTFLFTAFQTCSMIQQSVIEGVKKEKPDFNASGYYSLAIVYSTFAIFNWIAPAIICFIGSAASMIVGALTYLVFIINFFWPMEWSFYASSAIVGAGAAIIWTGQGKFFTIHSNEKTLGRNSGIFWAIFQTSLLLGNIYVYTSVKTDIIDKALRNRIFTIFSIIGSCGIFLFIVTFIVHTCCTSRTKEENDHEIDNEVEEHIDDITTRSLLEDGENQEVTIKEKDNAFIQSIKEIGVAVRLLGEKKMLFLLIIFAYTGFVLTFFSGVYGTSIGHIKKLGDHRKSFIGLCGILIGCGEIAGGSIFGLCGTFIKKVGRRSIIVVGFLLHVAAFILIILSLPKDSPIRETSVDAYLKPTLTLYLTIAFLLGAGDSSYNTQCYSLIGSIWSQKSAPAFAIFKFVQSLAAATGFFTSSYMYIWHIMTLLLIFQVIGTVLLIVVEAQSRKDDEEEPVN